MNKVLGIDSCLSDVEKLKQRFEAALQGVREEFDDHREAINDNTAEIEANYELMCRLDSKLDKVSEELEELKLTFAQLVRAPNAHNNQATQLQHIELTRMEKEIFLILYTASEDAAINYKELAKCLKESEFLIRGYVTNMMEKGVPIIKRYRNDVAVLSLPSTFKELQAKRNIVRLDQKTVKDFFAECATAQH